MNSAFAGTAFSSPVLEFLSVIFSKTLSPSTETTSV
jgi:hypothetical protein